MSEPTHIAEVLAVLALRQRHGLPDPRPRHVQQWPSPALQPSRTPRPERQPRSTGEAADAVLRAATEVEGHDVPSLTDAAQGDGCDSCMRFAGKVADYMRSNRGNG